MSIVFLNGQFVEQSQASVSVFDRGFLFGDGVYEVIPVYSGNLFRLDEHLERLNHSLASIEIALNWSAQRWDSLFAQLLEKNNIKHCSMYIQITRGVDKQRDHTFSGAVAPTVFAMTMPLPQFAEDAFQKGVAAITTDDIRWKRCDIKATSLLGNVLMRQEAARSGAQEAIVINDGFAIEGSTSNLFVVKDGVIRTPPKTPLILGGITRDLVVELCQKSGLAMHEEPIEKQVLVEADEIWLTSSTKELRAVVTLDGKPVGKGIPGPIYQKALSQYLQFKTRMISASEPI